MKKYSAMFIAFILVSSVQFNVQAASFNKDVNNNFDKKFESTVNQILIMQPGVSADELEAEVEELSVTMGMSKEEIYNQMYNEMEEQNRLAEVEAIQLAEELAASDDMDALGGGSGALLIVGPSAQGDFYYTPSSTAYVNHGHVGLYYTGNTIVESIYPSGVRSISANVRKVDKGAVVRSISASSTVKKNAATWAYGERGQNYSLNFANNRNTGHNGAKNCSKLIWSAFKLKGNMDLDVNKGLGVYPRDVRDASQTAHKRTVK
ncbi:hypothetical protein QWT69_03500 [Sporosarcina oncorhynchi]|uniref:YycO n=1 Tax=Sporosarcina oncorhynchi TaxID=3056444 RepID=A0ABZ0L7Z7_9BACL|nr:hypothetical protein [Sporosarcina sp. T2O-4]WOV88203.1 hypothetical protein QWT69_03500 [Sporosarcina sp. T2O-4]